MGFRGKFQISNDLHDTAVVEFPYALVKVYELRPQLQEQPLSHQHQSNQQYQSGLDIVIKCTG